MSVSKLIFFSFSGHPVAFGFWASFPPDNITLNPANKRIDQNLSDFPTGIGAAAYATLNREQLWLILWPPYRVLMVEWLQLQKCMNYLPRFMTFWTMLFLNRLVIQIIFNLSLLILLPGSIGKSRLLNFPFFIVWRILFLPVRLVFMPTPTGPWHRSTHQFLISVRGARARTRAGFWFNVQKWPYWSLVVPICQRSRI